MPIRFVKATFSKLVKSARAFLTNCEVVAQFPELKELMEQEDLSESTGSSCTEPKKVSAIPSDEDDDFDFDSDEDDSPADEKSDGSTFGEAPYPEPELIPKKILSKLRSKLKEIKVLPVIGFFRILLNQS
jgi:hypothetical protein